MGDKSKEDALRYPYCDARIDRLPTSMWSWKIFAMTSLAILFGWSNYVSGLVLAQLAEIGWTNTSISAVFTAAYMGGMLLGSLLGGVIGDAIGRRKGYLLFVGFHALTMYLAALASSMPVLIALRAAMGFGLGALLVALYAGFVEYVPASTRGCWMGRNTFLGNCGGPICSVLATLITPFVMADMNWRLMFVIPAVLSTVVWIVALKQYPESPRWLESKGRFEDADRVMSDIEMEVQRDRGEALPEYEKERAIVHKAQEASYSELLHGRLLKRVILGSVALIAMNVTAYTLMTWLPSMLLLKGIDIHSSFFLYTLTVLGAPIGAFLLMVCIDKLPRKVMGTLLLIFIALVGPLFAIQSDPILICLLGFLLQVVVEMYVCFSSGVYIPEIWPTEIRMRGSGLANSIGRVSGMAMPFLVAYLLDGYGVFPVFIMMSIVAVMAAVVIAVLGVDTRGTSVGQIGNISANNCE